MDYEDYSGIRRSSVDASAEEDYERSRHEQWDNLSQISAQSTIPGTSRNGSMGFGRFTKRFSNEADNNKSREFSSVDGGAKPVRQRRASLTQRLYTQTLAAVSDIEKLAQKRGANPLNEKFKVMPDDAYPNTYFNREELRTEMNKKSAYFHDLRMQSLRGQEVGQLRLEVLQCFGIPSTSLIRETQAYCIAVCGPYAFKTDVMPPVANPMWLAKMRRACMFPVNHAYARLMIGVFDNSSEGSVNDFAGRVVIDIARLRPGTTYDITLPLRRSAHIFAREHRGAIRVRFHLIWQSERAAVMSYIPKEKPKFQPNESVTVNCLDDRSFRNVSQVVHGAHMPGKFSMTLLKATVREVNFTRIHVLRYIRKREMWNLSNWKYPIISGFVFVAWMHCVYVNSVAHVPGHILTFLLLHLWKNYAYYAMDSPLSSGFQPPSVEELLYALVRGTKRKKCIEPLSMTMDESHSVNPLEHMEAADDYNEANKGTVPLHEIAESMRKSLPLQTHTYRLRAYRNCFVGSDAVDFLVNFGYAYSREEAVRLGRRLEEEAKLFEHVARKHKFEDDYLFYHFLSYDTKKYQIQSHRARGRRLMGLLGFLPEEDILEERAHVEFPFATGTDHARFTVKESLVIRSAEAKKMVKQEEMQREMTDCAEFGVAPSMLSNANEDDQSADGGPGAIRDFRRSMIGSMNAVENIAEKAKSMTSGHGAHMVGDPDEIYDQIAKHSGNNPSLEDLLEEQRRAAREDKYCYDSDGDVDTIGEVKRKGRVVIEEKYLKKPPNQDMNIKNKSGDKSFSQVLQETRHKAHGLLLHLFNDRVYKIDPRLFPNELPMEEDQEVEKKSKGSRLLPFGRSQPKPEKKKKKEKKQQTPNEIRKDEYDKLLQVNKYSHPNPWINRVAVIVQPIVEIVQEFVCMFRALFNLFTWQDPILSFWVAVLGPLVVLILHFLPYRFLFLVAGIVFVGPQNYFLRLVKERTPGYTPPDFDKLVKRKRVKKEGKGEEMPYFSSEAPGNRSLFFKRIDPMLVKQVVVPYTPIKYARFYDWPPENEYARVHASAPPRNDPMDESINGYDSETDSNSYWFDPTQNIRGSKKKKKGMRKIASQAKKGARMGAGVVVGSAGVVVGASVGTMKGAARMSAGAAKGAAKVTSSTAKATSKVTKSTVKGATKVTKSTVKGASKVTKSTVKGAAKTTGWLGLRRRRRDDESYDGYQ